MAADPVTRAFPASCESLVALEMAANGRMWPLSKRTTVWEGGA